MTDINDQSRDGNTCPDFAVLVHDGNDWRAATLLKWQHDLAGRRWAVVTWSDPHHKSHVVRIPERKVWTAD